MEPRHPFSGKPVSKTFPELGIIRIHGMQLDFLKSVKAGIAIPVDLDFHR